MFFRKAAIDKLRQRAEWGMRDLPDTIRVPALESYRPHEVVIALEESTLDDLAFAMIGIESQIAEMRRPLVGLRELYEQARKRGGVGSKTVSEVFLQNHSAEVTK